MFSIAVGVIVDDCLGMFSVWVNQVIQILVIFRWKC